MKLVRTRNPEPKSERPLRPERGDVLRARGTAGFSLIELLVVIGIIAILAGLLLTALARSKEKGRHVVCISNLKQLALAFRLYVDDNEDTFPGAAAKSGSTKPVREDWIYWNTQDANIRSADRRNFQRSPIATYVEVMQTNLFRCPSDRDVLKREASPRPGQIPYVFSYTANSCYDMSSTNNHGILSLIPDDPYYYTLLFKSSDINNPSDKIMLLEEYADANTPDDGRWTPSMTNRVGLDHPPPFPNIRSDISNRHSRRGVVVMCDGHTETVKPSFGNERQHFDPKF